LTRYSRGTVYICATVSLLLSAAVAADYYRERPDPTWPVVHGQVVARDSVTRFYFMRRPKLTIRLEPDGPSVTAVLMTDSSANIPDRVSFRYGGNPSKEVHLLAETSPVLVAALIGSLAPLLFLIWPWYERSLKARA
jgi:hypothetical protein